MSDIEEVRGQAAVIRFEGKRCIHARHCVLSRPDVFVPNVEGAWIHPDRATPEELVALALACPSGAIQVERLDGGKGEGLPLVNTARIRENGPVALHGELTVDGTAMTRATLCRCGASKNKPYCDGSHAGAGFTATGEPETKPSEPLPRRDGPLALTALPNGPVKAVGALELLSGTGRTVLRTEKAFLCRCGGSANKPFCDGTHAKIGFKST